MAQSCSGCTELITTPGQAPSSTTMAEVTRWTRIGEQEATIIALRLDAQNEIVEERVGRLRYDLAGPKKGSPNGSSDDNEVEDGTKTGGAGGVRHSFQTFRCPSASGTNTLRRAATTRHAIYIVQGN